MNEYAFAACNNQCIALNQVTDTIESEGLLLHQIQFSFPLLNRCQASSPHPSLSLSFLYYSLFTRSVCVFSTYNDPSLCVSVYKRVKREQHHSLFHSAHSLHLLASHRQQRTIIMSLFSKFTKNAPPERSAAYPWTQRKLGGSQSSVLPRYGHAAAAAGSADAMVLFGGTHMKSKKDLFLIDTSMCVTCNYPPRQYQD